MEEQSSMIRLLGPAMALLIGLSFALTGLLKPGFMWDTGKLQAGRRLFGDAGMTAFLVILGAALIAIGVYAFIKVRGR